MSVVAVAAGVAAAFNLVCSGMTTESFGPGKESSQKPFHRVYRVDLESRRWCADDCPVTLPITIVTPQEIQLGEPPVFVPGDGAATTLDRETGRIVRALGGKGHAIIDFGECEKAPFTPFPKPKF
jgi:hypothetical protein